MADGKGGHRPEYFNWAECYLYGDANDVIMP
jgi:hypothetical protein